MYKSDVSIIYNRDWKISSNTLSNVYMKNSLFSKNFIIETKDDIKKIPSMFIEEKVDILEQNLL